MKNKKGLILYQYNKFTRDLTYIKEYYNKEEILQDFKSLNKINSIRNYIIKDLDKINDNIKMIDNSYILMY